MAAVEGPGSASQGEVAVSGGEPARRTKLVKVRVSEQRIRARPPRKCRGLSEEMLQRPPKSQEEADLRACIVEMAALSKAAYDREMGILEQFEAKGYAEVDVAVEDIDDKHIISMEEKAR
jgi:hypothetical protein